MLTKMAESNEYVEQLIQTMLDEVDKPEKEEEEGEGEDAMIVF